MKIEKAPALFGLGLFLYVVLIPTLSAPDGVIVSRRRREICQSEVCEKHAREPIDSPRGESIFVTWSPKIFIEASAWL